MRPKSCVVCGRRTPDGAARCPAHKYGGLRMRPCVVCARPTQTNYCPDHEPQVDETARLERQPYRKAYQTREYQVHRQHAFERARGRCELCGTGPMRTGEWECDHRIPLRDGGSNLPENLRILCKPCHGRITKATRRARN